MVRLALFWCSIVKDTAGWICGFVGFFFYGTGMGWWVRGAGFINVSLVCVLLRPISTLFHFNTGLCLLCRFLVSLFST